MIALECPVCDNPFESRAVVSTNYLGGKRTDFHERAAGTQPLPYLIHMCGVCCFTGSERDFMGYEELEPMFKEQIREELYRIVETKPAPGSMKYEAAARAAEIMGRDAYHVADLLLRAAWCCVEEEDSEADRYFRRHAARKFEEALNSYEGCPVEERARLTYLVGELWRRVGDDALAAEWFDKVPDEIVDDETQQWILIVAKQQKLTPRQWFSFS